MFMWFLYYKNNIIEYVLEEITVLLLFYNFYVIYLCNRHRLLSSSHQATLIFMFHLKKLHSLMAYT